MTVHRAAKSRARLNRLSMTTWQELKVTEIMFQLSFSLSVLGHLFFLNKRKYHECLESLHVALLR